MAEFLLSICIPTYNRGKFLDISLERLEKEYNHLVDSSLVELIVSDNCSTDDTSLIIRKYWSRGLPICYFQNQENLGMDGNFIQCLKKARGQYIWLLGDDDFLKEGSLVDILNLLKNGNYGLVHLQINGDSLQGITEYTSSHKFLTDVTFWITFISSNIVKASYVQQIDFEKYKGTYFTQVPLYLAAVWNEKCNLMVHKKMLEEAADAQSNGSYNFFQVFVINYLKIWKEFLVKKGGSRFWYEKEKYSLLRNFLLNYIRILLLKKKLGNFRVENAWKILFKYYGIYPYFYFYLGITYFKFIRSR